MNAARPPWHAGLPPVTVEVDWGSARHRITWRAGKLVLDHHRDLAAEQAFVALGGERCPCLDLLAAWREWHADPDVLVGWADPQVPPAVSNAMLPPGNLLSATPGQLLAQLRARFHAVRTQLTAMGGVSAAHGRVAVSASRPTTPPPGGAHPRAGGTAAPGTPGRRGGPGGRGFRSPPPPVPSAQQRQQMLAQFEERHRELWAGALLWGMPAPLRDRLAVGAVEGAARRRDDGRVWARWRRPVELALAARAVPALQENIRFWRGRVEAGPRRPTVEAWVTQPGEEVSLFGLVDRAGGWAAASIGAGWLADVWARGMAVVDGCFVIAVTGWDEHPDRLSVLATRWERRLGEGSTPVIEPAVVVPTRVGTWALRWS